MSTFARLSHTRPLGLSSLARRSSVIALVLWAAPAAATTGDFDGLDLAAAAPFTYDHTVGGGAYDDATKGKSLDVVESLEGGDFTCGDHVTYLVAVDMANSVVDPVQTVTFDLSLLADSTGQTGGAHVDIQNVQVNYGPVVAGDGVGGIDAGMFDDGGSTATLLTSFFAYDNDGSPAPGPFTGGASLVARIQVDDLEAGEQVIVRVDGILGCKAYSSPTGNLQASLSNVVTSQPTAGTTVNAGAQTIPFQKIGEIIGAGEPAILLTKTVTTEFGSCPGVETLDVEAGDIVKYCYTVTNNGTDNLAATTVTDDNATPGDASDDFAVSLSFPSVCAGYEDVLLPGSICAGGGTATGTALVSVDSSGTLTNIATATGTDGASRPTSYTDTDTATVIATAPPASLALSVTASLDDVCGNADDSELGIVPEGATTYYCYEVTNSGTTTVSGVTISDPYNAVSGVASIAAGESYTFISDPVFALDYDVASGTATGTSGGTNVTSNEDGAAVDVVTSALVTSVVASLNETCGDADDTELQNVVAGTDVYYCYTVSNAGETTLTDVTVYDEDAVVSGTVDLEPGDRYTFVSDAVYTTLDETHTAFAEGIDSLGQLVPSNDDTAGADVLAPSVHVSKTVSTDGTCAGDEFAAVLAGDTVTYCYVVTNTGDTTLEGLVLVDGDVTLSIGTLAPGAAWTGEAEAAVTEDTTTEASVSGIEPLTGSVVGASDEASVDVVHPSVAITLTVSDDGTCPGDEVVNVLENDDVTWCYTVVNTGDVALTDVVVSDPRFGEMSLGDLAVGESIDLGSADSAQSDALLSATVTASDLATGSSVSDADDATVNVVYPGINVDVTVSADGFCPGLDAASVVAGDEVVWCYDVTNLGDTTAYDIELYDGNGALVGTIDSLAPGEDPYSFVSAPVSISTSTLELASVSGTDEFGFYVSDDDAASVDALYSDLNIDISAPSTIVLTETDTIGYTIVITNEGSTTAEDSLLTQTIPDGLTLTEYPDACTLTGSELTCDLGDVEPGAVVTIEVSGTTDASLSTLESSVFVETTTPESDATDNRDEASTYVAPGATRTIGFYSTHPTFVADCLAASGGTIDLGFVRLANEAYDDEIDSVNGGDKDRDVETGLELAMGVLNANVMKYTSRVARSELEKARMQAGRQVLAAICNTDYLGAHPGSLDLDAAVATLAGSDIGAILQVSAAADAYNNAGDSISLRVSPGPAVAKYPWDDPTDKND